MAVTFNDDPATELEALNLMLLSIGKSPVNTTNVPGVNDVSNAMTILYATVRQVQTRAWWFNFEQNFPITPDGSGYINRPEACVDFFPTIRGLPLVERNAKLYDLCHHTFTIPTQYLNQDGTLRCNVTWCFPYEQVPQVAREAIFARAGRVFQTNVVGSQLIYQFTKERELDGFAELERAQLRNSGTNMFTSNTRNSRISNRQPNAYYRQGV